MTALSIVMPVFNESGTITRALERVLSVDYPCSVELITVDDGSTDETAALLDRFRDRGVTVLRHAVNRGKGAAVLTGVEKATGTHLLVLDADLEYDPADIPAMLVPVLTGVSDHVFGARVFGVNTRFPSYRYAKGGRLTTAVANVLFDSCLTDMHTCLKLLPRDHFHALMLSRPGFGLDTELTARMLHAGIRPFEVPISYFGRTFDEGKKITWRDGVECLRILFSIRFQKREVLPAGPFETEAVVVPISSTRLIDVDLDHDDDAEIASAAT